MEGQISLTREDLEQGLPEQGVRGARIIHLAMMMAFLLFVAIVFFVQTRQSSEPAPADGSSFLTLLSLVNAGLAVVTFALAAVIPRQMLARTRPRNALQAFQLYLAARIGRLALMEGGALFGAVVTLLGVLQGNLQAQPLYWLNLLPGLIFVAILSTTVPSRDRILDDLQHHFTH